MGFTLVNDDIFYDQNINLPSRELHLEENSTTTNTNTITDKYLYIEDGNYDPNMFKNKEV